MVSCPTWLHCVSYRQETFRVWFPIRHGAIAFHTGRKLFAYSFPSGMAPLRFISTGNFSQIVSYPAWRHCVSSQQETFHKWFPIRHGAIAFHTGRKLFANGFPFGMTPLCFISVGNYPQMVSPPAWRHCVSYQQETIRISFPVRHGSIAFHLNRKLFAYRFLSGMAPLRFIPTGNFSRMLSHSV